MTKEFDKRNAAKSRKVCEAMAEAASTGKRVLTERERQILATWPRFEDGEPVWFGDAFQNCKGDNRAVCGIEFYPHRFWLVDDDGWQVGFGIVATLNDEAGGTWHIDPKKITHVQPDSWERLEEDASKDTCVYFGVTEHFDCSECSSGGTNCFGRMKSDLIRRAKALAGVEAD